MTADAGLLAATLADPGTSAGFGPARWSLLVKQARVAMGGRDLDEAKAAVLSAIKALDHAASKGTIHKNYNGWIQNLDNAIQRELSALM